MFDDRMNKTRSTKLRAADAAPRNAKMERILDCAEKEFAARGYTSTSMQQIAKSAKVNQALISYYFGSKEKLYRAIFLRRGLELSGERLRLLDELQQRGSPPTVDELIKSFLLPAIKMRYGPNNRSDFLRLQARLQNEPKEITGKLRAIVYDKVTRRYIDAFSAALPNVAPETIVWRVVMMIGAYLYVLSDESRLEQLSDGECDAANEEELLRQISNFLFGGFNSEVGERADRPSARAVLNSIAKPRAA
jgi:AcrR family transcriptional regulator